MAERTNVAIQQREEDETPDRSARVIRQDIVAKREAISETVDKIGERIHGTFDWHEYVTEYPAVALGLAAGAGFLIAGMFKRRPTPQQRILDAVAELTEEMGDRVGDVLSGAIQKKLFSSRTLRAAATAMIAKAAAGYVRNRVVTAMSGADSPAARPTTQSNAISKFDTNVQPSHSSTAGSRG